MPNFLESKLKANVPKGVDPDRYVYGAMNNMGAMKGNQITAKGKAMEAKHAHDFGPRPGTLNSPNHGLGAPNNLKRAKSMLSKKGGK